MVSQSLPAALRKRRKIDRDMAIYNSYHAGISTATLCKRYELNRSQVCKIIREIEVLKNLPNIWQRPGR